MVLRRMFLQGLMASGFVAQASGALWADVAGRPSYLAAAGLSDGSYVLCGISKALEVVFRLPLPQRGHAAAAHPRHPEAVAFARRPGVFALVLDCHNGQIIAQLSTPPARHFYGHGAFSQDGRWLFTTENDYENARGVIGVWDRDDGYARVDEFSSGGIGPHDIKRLPGSEMLVVANGGIDTHPDTGRMKLNLDSMCPNLSYIRDGAVQQVVELGARLHKNSMRHLGVARDGRVAVAMQWEGEGDVESLVGLHLPGADSIDLFSAPRAQIGAMNAYIGSIAFGPGDRELAVTSPRGGRVQIYDPQGMRWTRSYEITDVSGIAAHDDGFIATSGTGGLRALKPDAPDASRSFALSWDNHLIAIDPSVM